MRKNPVDVVGCQYRLWALIARHAPKVMMDLFDSGNAMEWHAKWKLPDWCLRLAESALLNPRGGHTRRSPTITARTPVDVANPFEVPKKYATTSTSRITKRGARNIRRAAWLWTVYSSVYYFKPPALKLTLSLWAAEETFTALPLEELKQRVVEAVERCLDEAVAKYDAEYIQPIRVGERSWLFPSPDKAKNRQFDLHAKWLIAYRLNDTPQKVIALNEGKTEQAVSKAINELADQLEFPADAKTT